MYLACTGALSLYAAGRTTGDRAIGTVTRERFGCTALRRIVWFPVFGALFSA